MEKFVVAKIFIQPAFVTEFQQKLDELAILTKKEAGCIEYGYYADQKENGAFVLIERYRDQASLKYHFDQSYVLEFLTSMVTWRSEDPQVHFLSINKEE